MTLVVGVVVNEEEDLVFPMMLSIVNEVFDFGWRECWWGCWWWWWFARRGIVGGSGGSKGIGGGNIGKQRLFGDVVGMNGKGIGGNDGGAGGGGGTADGTDPWWKQAEWWWWWWWWLIRLKRLRRRKNEPLSNIFSLAGSNVQ